MNEALDFVIQMVLQLTNLRPFEAYLFIYVSAFKTSLWRGKSTHPPSGYEQNGAQIVNKIYFHMAERGDWTIKRREEW